MRRAPARQFRDRRQPQPVQPHQVAVRHPHALQEPQREAFQEGVALAGSHLAATTGVGRQRRQFGGLAVVGEADANVVPRRQFGGFARVDARERAATRPALEPWGEAVQPAQQRLPGVVEVGFGVARHLQALDPHASAIEPHAGRDAVAACGRVGVGHALLLDDDERAALRAGIGALGEVERERAEVERGDHGCPRSARSVAENTADGMVTGWVVTGWVVVSWVVVSRVVVSRAAFCREAVDRTATVRCTTGGRTAGGRPGRAGRSMGGRRRVGLRDVGCRHGERDGSGRSRDEHGRDERDGSNGFWTVRDGDSIRVYLGSAAATRPLWATKGHIPHAWRRWMCPSFFGTGRGFEEGRERPGAVNHLLAGNRSAAVLAPRRRAAGRGRRRRRAVRRPTR